MSHEIVATTAIITAPTTTTTDSMTTEKNLRRGVHFAYTRPRRYKMWRLASTDVDSNKN